MKRLLLIAFLLFTFSAIPAMAADWTVVTAAVCDGSPYAWGDNSYLYCYKISATSNADSSGDHTLSTMLTTAYGAQESEKRMRQLAGTTLFWVDYEPGSVTPTTETQITIDKETTALIFDETVTTAATAQSWRGNNDTTSYAPITDVTIAMTTLADTKTANVYLWFLGGRK